MSLVLERETPPLREDETGVIQVRNFRVLLEVAIRAFQDGASPMSIIHQYSTLSLFEVYIDCISAFVSNVGDSSLAPNGKIRALSSADSSIDHLTFEKPYLEEISN